MIRLDPESLDRLKHAQMVDGEVAPGHGDPFDEWHAPLDVIGALVDEITRLRAETHAEWPHRPPWRPDERIRSALRAIHADPDRRMRFTRRRLVIEGKPVTSYEWKSERLTVAVYVEPAGGWGSLLVQELPVRYPRMAATATLRSATEALEVLSALCLLPEQCSRQYSLGWFAGRRSAR